MSLSNSFRLWQFCVLLLCLFRLPIDFVEDDHDIESLVCVRVFVTEFEMAAFEDFEQ